MEQAEMMPMPAPFDGYVEKPVRVSNTALVSLGRNRYSVPCEFAGRWVSSRLYPTRIDLVADDAVIASHARLLDRDQVSYDWQHYLPLIERKPGRYVMARPSLICPGHCANFVMAWHDIPAEIGSWPKCWQPYQWLVWRPCW